MNSPVTVNAFEEIAREQVVALRREGEKICNGLVRRNRSNILLENARITKAYQIL